MPIVNLGTGPLQYLCSAREASARPLMQPREGPTAPELDVRHHVHFLQSERGFRHWSCEISRPLRSCLRLTILIAYEESIYRIPLLGLTSFICKHAHFEFTLPLLQITSALVTS